MSQRTYNFHPFYTSQSSSNNSAPSALPAPTQRFFLSSSARPPHPPAPPPRNPPPAILPQVPSPSTFQLIAPTPGTPPPLPQPQQRPVGYNISPSYLPVSSSTYNTPIPPDLLPPSASDPTPYFSLLQAPHSAMSQPSHSPAPLRNPFPALLPPQIPTRPTSRRAALSTPIPPPPLQPLQLPQYPVDYRTPSSHLTVPSLSNDTPFPPNLVLPSTLGQTTCPPLPLALQEGSRPTLRPTLRPASRPPAPLFGGHAGFTGAHDFIINDPSFINISHAGSGLTELLKHSMPDAAHNAAARDPPPKCHLGTRKEYISMITNWAQGNLDHNEPILWMRGPFGVGKSAVAQSCAEAFQLQNKLAATLFLSRSNTNRDDPRRVFTSIAYQIAIICPPFRDLIDSRIRGDPSLTAKSLSTQFQELLIDPLGQIDITRSGIEGRVVVIDGLDECRGSSEQSEIIRVIAASARDQKTPFRWFITSRPEDIIVRTMRSPAISAVSFHLELPVSRKIDHEILLYLTDEFKKIREGRGLTESWPSGEDVALLVERAAGLWIYVATIIRFIVDENSLGPRDQLRIVIEFAKDISARVGSDNPLAEMDYFYTLIMQRIPLRIRTLIRKILLLHSIEGMSTAYFVVGVLGLTGEQFRHLCTFIQSVVEIRDSGSDFGYFHFYHASFLDFMKDPERSKELCIYGSFLNQYRREWLEWLYKVCSSSTDHSDITFPSNPVLREDWDRGRHYHYSLGSFWRLCEIPDSPIDIHTSASLEKFTFKKMLRLLSSDGGFVSESSSVQDLRDNLPAEFRDKIIRQDNCPIPGCMSTGKAWIFGHGDNEIVASCNPSGGLWFRNNQDPPPGQCFCGSWLKGACLEF